MTGSGAGRTPLRALVIGIVELGDAAVGVDDGDFGNGRGGDLLDDDDGIGDGIEHGPVVTDEFEGHLGPPR